MQPERKQHVVTVRHSASESTANVSQAAVLETSQQIMSHLEDPTSASLVPVVRNHPESSSRLRDLGRPKTSKTQRGCLIATLLEASEGVEVEVAQWRSPRCSTTSRPTHPPTDKIMHKSSRMHLELRGYSPRGKDPTIISVVGG
jgi:hypothetical protein